MARAGFFSRSSTKRATGAANWKPTPPLESDYILLHTLLGTGDPSAFRSAANWIIQHQNEDGGWSIYVDAGPSNISASVKAYFALKLAGYKPSIPCCSGPARKFSRWAG
jgi:hypothetical protein